MALLAHPPLTPRYSSEDEAHRPGELSPDGIASLERPSTRSGFVGSDHSVTPNRQRPSIKRADSSAQWSAGSLETTSDDGYDAFKIDPTTVVEGSKGGGLQAEATLGTPHRSRLSLKSLRAIDTSNVSTSRSTSPEPPARFQHERRKSIPVKLRRTGTNGRYVVQADDPELMEILRRGIQREAEGKDKKKRSRFSDLVFTRQFTAFDRQNPMNASSPFHGFFTLFWLGTFLLLVKVAANNWKVYGSIFGRNEIMTIMFHHDVLVLGLTDGVMCASTAFCLLLQKTIARGYLSWNKQGWIIQNVSS